MAAWIQGSSGIDSLTERQREVLRLITAGRTNPEIAENLGFSLAGAKWHVSEVISRLGVETREEAAEIWREQHSLPRRFTRSLGGLAGLGTLKVALGVAAVAGVAVVSAGFIARVHDMRSGDGGPMAVAAQSQALPAFPNAIYSRAEAKDIAYRLAQGEFDTYQLQAHITKDGRPIQISDLTVGFHDFVEDATVIRHTLSHSHWPNGEGRDIWTFELVADGFTSDQFGNSMIMALMFEDGGTEMLGAGIVWPAAAPPSGRAPHPIADEPIGSFASGTDSWSILTAPEDDGWILALRSGSEGISYGFGPVGPGLNARDGADLFGVIVFETGGFGYVLGAVSNAVARLDVVVEDGRTATLLPQAPEVGSAFPYKVFGAAFPGSVWVVEVHAFDADGNAIGSNNFWDHPTNP